MNCIAQLNPDKVAPAVPQNLKIQPAKNQIILTWKKSADNKTMLGYNIYQNSKRIGFTPDASFTIQKSMLPETRNFAVKAVDFAGNESGFSKTVSN